MVSTSLRKYVSVALGVLFFTTTVFAVENFKVPVSNLRVYSQPSTLSAVITTLNMGQTVQAGSNPAGGFKKVLVVDRTGKKKIGFVALADLPGGGGGARGVMAKPAPTSRRTTRSGGGGGLPGRWAFGLVGGLAYDMEGGRNITDTNNALVTSNALTGTAPQFGGFLYVPWGLNKALNFYAYYKSSTLTGTYPSSQLPGQTPAISITQSFLSLGGLLELYVGRSSWWFGPAVQLDYGLSASATLNGTAYTLSTNQFVGLFAATGYDIGFTDTIYMTPQIQFGVDVNASPMIIEGNFLLNFAYRY